MLVSEDCSWITLLMDERSRSDTESRPPAARRPRGRILGCERGVTLIELLTVIPMLAVTLMATYALNNIATRSQTRTSDRAHGLIQQQVGFERMSRELRQATTITPVSSEAIDVTTWVRPPNADASVKRRVRYECTTSCQRWEGPENGALTDGPALVIANVQNPDVFTLMPDSVNPTYVALRVEATVKGAAKPIIFDGGFALKNQSGV
jgi:Tfp pilus assembly protein PilE